MKNYELRIAEVLRAAENSLIQAGLLDAKSSAEVLLSEILGIPRGNLYFKKDERLSTKQQETFQKYIKRRATHEPVAYILGFQEFYGRKFKVNKDVLIPRPETEELIDLVLPEITSKTFVVDVGSGSGVIATTIAAETNAAQIMGVDISDPTRLLAFQNAMSILPEAQIARRIGFFPLLDGLSSLPALVSSIHSHFPGPLVIIANLPYIPHSEMQTLSQDVKEFEPSMALDGGVHGTEIIEELLSIFSKNSHFHKCERLLFLEIDPSNVPRLQEVFALNKELKAVFIKDLSGQVRFVKVELASPV